MMAALILFAVLLGLVLYFIIQTVRSKGPTTPSCGKCGYNVFGLTSFICPECGSDLREVGIKAPKQQSTGAALAMNLIGWTFLFLLVTCVGSGILVALFNTQVTGAAADTEELATVVWLGITTTAWLIGMAWAVRDYLRQRRGQAK